MPTNPTIKSVEDINVENIKDFNGLLVLLDYLSNEFKELEQIPAHLTAIRTNLDVLANSINPISLLGAFYQQVESFSQFELALFELKPSKENIMALKKFKEVFKKLNHIIQEAQKDIIPFCADRAKNITATLQQIPFIKKETENAFIKVLRCIPTIELFLEWKIEAFSNPQNINLNSLVADIKTKLCLNSCEYDGQNPSTLIIFNKIMFSALKWIDDQQLQKDNPELQNQMLFAMKALNENREKLKNHEKHILKEKNNCGWFDMISTGILNESIKRCQTCEDNFVTNKFKIETNNPEQLLRDGKVIATKTIITHELETPDPAIIILRNLIVVECEYILNSIDREQKNTLYNDKNINLLGIIAAKNTLENIKNPKLNDFLTFTSAIQRHTLQLAAIFPQHAATWKTFIKETYNKIWNFFGYNVTRSASTGILALSNFAQHYTSTSAENPLLTIPHSVSKPNANQPK